MRDYNDKHYHQILEEYRGSGSHDIPIQFIYRAARKKINKKIDPDW